MSAPDAPSARDRRARVSAPTAAALLVWVALVAITAMPVLKATLAPPRGAAFTGAFFYKGDFYNYLSFVRQAEEGAFLFENKLLLERHPPALVNLEWWVLGRASVLLGGRPVLAYRLLGVAAALALLLAFSRWLARAGLSDSHQLAALLLVALGGGLGGLLYRGLARPIGEALDLVAGLYPFTETLFNPHFLVGTALLAWGLLLLSSDRPRDQAAGIVVGTVLGLCRPYDVVLLVLARVLAVAAGPAPSRGRIRALLPLLGLAPVYLYNAWVFLLAPWFRSFQQTAPFPPRLHLLWALGPAIALSVVGWRRSWGRSASPEAVHLIAWPMCALAIALANPVSFSLQFLQGSGGAWLAVGALGLQRFRPWVTLAAALAFSTTAWAAVALTLADNPYWLASRADMDIAYELRRVCRPGDVVFAPPDPGLFATGLSSCRGVVSHTVAGDYRERLQDVARFYTRASAAERAALLDRYRAAYVVWPGDAPPADWLGAGAAFRKETTIPTARGPLSLYVRLVP